MNVTRALSAKEREATARGAFVRVDLEREVVFGGLPARSLLVGYAEGAWRAYANVCMHRAIPLDLGADTAMTDDGRFLLCHQHGARYRPEDGQCVGGPCVGMKLVAVGVEETPEGELILRVDDGNAP